MRKITFTTITTALLLALLAPLFAIQVFAGVGISPASIENNRLRPGSTFEKEIVFSRSDVEDSVQVTLEPDLGEVNDWLTFSPGQVFNVEAGVQRVPIKVTFNVPADATLSPITGSIRVKVSDGAAAAGSVEVIKGAKIDVSLATTNSTFIDFLVRSITVAEVDNQGVGSLTVKVENTGNTTAAPSKVDLDFLDFDENLVTSTSVSGFDPIAPGETKDMKLNFTLSGIAKGEYFVDASVYSENRLLRQERLVVNVLGSTSSDVSVNDTTGGNSGELIQFLEENRLLALLLVVFIAVSVTALLVFLFRSSEEREQKKKTATV